MAIAPAPGTGLAEFQLVIPSETKYLNLVTGLAKRAALVAGLDDAAAAKVSIAVDEAVTNVILHAYNGEASHQVELDLRFTPQALEVHIFHTGQGMREDQIVLPDPKEYVTHPRKGGLGLLLMSRFMDEVRFREASGRNECCLIKKIS
jgi:serine/threonine-protein kinase RsbW